MLPPSTVGITAASVPHITPGASVVIRPSWWLAGRCGPRCGGGKAFPPMRRHTRARPRRPAVRREQSILAHEAQHPAPADTEAIERAQAGPDLAVPLAGEGRAVEVVADRLEQPRIVDRRPRPAPPARGRRLGDLSGSV